MSPVVRPARRAAEVQVHSGGVGQAKAQGEGGGKDQPGIGHQAVGKAIWMRRVVTW